VVTAEKGEAGMAKILMDFSIFPVDHGASLSAYVARAVDLVDQSGLPYRMGPMGTTVEGEYDECMALVQRCFEAMSQDSDRVILQVKVDYRRGRDGALQSKTKAVEGHLGRKLCT
jgi:uncharacterized protein (TIGR00106 family)